MGLSSVADHPNGYLIGHDRKQACEIPSNWPVNRDSLVIIAKHAFTSETSPQPAIYLKMYFIIPVL